jgi:uncharacterized repeat protein (TIGR03803 family)
MKIRIHCTFKTLLLGFLLIYAVDALYAQNPGTLTALYDFQGGNDGSYPVDYGRLARDASGNLFGTTQFGGTCGQGTIFEVSPNENGGWTESVLHAFCGSDGSVPLGDVVLDKSGNIYGTTSGNGNGTCGTVFELSGTTLNTLHAFTCQNDGGSPSAGVIFDNKGNLYGTANNVFEISRSGTFSVLYDFCQLPGCADGENPTGGVVIDAAGNLYGTASNGGDLTCIYAANGCGVVYKLSKTGASWSETVLHVFTDASSDGANPLYASLTLTTHKIGNKNVLVIFGVTAAGGQQGNGTVFGMLQQNSGFSFEVLHSFNCCFSDGTAPVGTLTFAKEALYGTTPQGGSSDSGTVFKVFRKNSGWTESVIYSFLNGSDGGHPYSGVAIDSAGILYGVAGSDGGEFGNVYQLTP